MSSAACSNLLEVDKEVARVIQYSIVYSVLFIIFVAIIIICIKGIYSLIINYISEKSTGSAIKNKSYNDNVTYDSSSVEFKQTSDFIGIRNTIYRNQSDPAVTASHAIADRYKKSRDSIDEKVLHQDFDDY